MKTAYPTIMGTCDIYLFANIPFDNSYAHHTLISKKFTYNSSAIYNASDETYGLACERFLNRRDPNDSDVYYYPRWKLTGDFNFNFSNGLIASVVLELTPAQTNANYLKLVCGGDIYYYFITGISQVNFDTYNLSLELDVMMTYQDEFLDGMKNVPVFTERKHCHRFTDDGIMPHSSDCLLNDSAFSGIKPSIIEEVIDLQHYSNDLDSIADVKWLYICSEGLAGTDETKSFLYKANDINYPLCMLAIPVNVGEFKITDGNTTITFTSFTHN